jgi:glutamate-ammonia-ligase adenylyltransferase
MQVIARQTGSPTPRRRGGRFLLADAQRRGRLKLADPTRPAQVGLHRAGHGQDGADELNYSSDIDLIVFYDADAGARRNRARAILRAAHARAGEAAAGAHRRRLRVSHRSAAAPDPASTQIAISTAAALDYYESRGQNWERAAMIKARPCAGDVRPARALKEFAPFIWRKYLDYIAVADCARDEAQIHSYRGHDEIAVEGHNIKLGRGGIREIEFFVQTQQLIAGGRIRAARTRDPGDASTCSPPAAGSTPRREDLAAAYPLLARGREPLQMVPTSRPIPCRPIARRSSAFAASPVFTGRDSFATLCSGTCAACQHHNATLFEHAPALEAGAGAALPADADDRNARQAHRDGLSPAARSLGARAALAAGATRRCEASSPRASSPRSCRAAASVRALGNPDAAVIAFDRFLAGLHGGGGCFRCCGRIPICRADRARARHRAAARRQPRAVSRGHGCGDRSELLRRAAGGSRARGGLDRSLEQASPTRIFLDRTRIVAQEHMFLIGTRILSERASAEQAGEAFAGSPTCSFARLRARSRQFRQAARPHQAAGNRNPGARQACAREMTPRRPTRSDRPSTTSTRSAPASRRVAALYGAQYFARLTPRLINALTAPTNHGMLYQVDMRLRPPAARARWRPSSTVL